MSVWDLLEKVDDRDTFMTFVRALVEDRKINEAAWQHNTIDNYLEAALACIEDNMPERDLMSQPSWRSLANFLYAGKIYE